MIRSETIGFDDIQVDFSTHTAELPDGYAGLDWQNMGAFDSAYWNEVDDGYSGYEVGATSGTQEAYSFEGSSGEVSLPGGSFTLDSVNLTAAWDKPLVVEVDGYRNGVEVHHERFKITDQHPTHIEIGFKDVDRVVFVTIRGRQDPHAGAIGDNIVFDDLSISRIKQAAAALPIVHTQLGSHTQSAQVIHVPLHEGFNHQVLAIV